jgi:hypothetical protein
MADSCSSSIDSTVINSDKSIQPETSVVDEKVNVKILPNNTRIQLTMKSEQYRQLKNKLFEIEQIKCEECLVYEQIDRLNSEKQHIQNLLNLLYAMDSNDRMKKSRCRQKRLQKT